jgi:phosphoribosylformylglycinamidine cyclo-ligase
MRLVGALGGVEDAELRATFNGGLGFIVVLDPADVPAASASLAAHGIAATLVGEVVPVAALDGARYVEAPLEVLA